MKVIVTGGAGFIGSNFIFYMMKKHPDYDIICLEYNLLEQKYFIGGII